MKIGYVAMHGNRGSDDTEGHIAFSLEKLGHEVVKIPQTGSPAMARGNFDLILFHHWYNVNLGFLATLKAKKVGWYFDKVWKGRDEWLNRVIPVVDHFFMSDGTWAAGAGHQNLHVLRQGIGDRDMRPGDPQTKRWKAQVAFLGSAYGERAWWTSRLHEKFGDKFLVYNDVFNRDLYDLCATVPIIVAPPFPSDDDYWSNRIYLTLGSGGFLIHPRLAGLAAEFDEGIHYVTYGSDEELEHRIRYYLENDDERRKIAVAGAARMQERFTFTHRVKELLSYVEKA